MILVKGCEVYSPEPLGRKDVLLAGSRIEAIADEIPEPPGLEVDVIPAAGLRMIPGLIDGHVHIAGAGGEGGPATRTPEVMLSQLLVGGITTVIGCLGTDGMTRSVESVLMKAKALRAEGVSCWIYTGSYQVPTPTILGDVGRDIALLEEVIGVGEVAIADHRSSCPSVEELIRLAEHARVGGMLGGKAGIVHLHMGDARDPFRLVYEAEAQSELPLTQFLPTHCNRNPHILEEARSFGKRGLVDLTAASFSRDPGKTVKASRGVVELLDAGVPLAHITVSSDGCGSLPSFDAEGNLVGLQTGEPSSIFVELHDLVEQEGLPLEGVLPVMTSNVSRVLRLHRKGRLAVGMDADLVLLDASMQVRHLAARGELLVRDGERLRKGTFEK